MEINEIFYSIQGEGAQTGLPSIFIRTKGCKAQHACAQLGVVCDTEFESGGQMDVQQILKHIVGHEWPCKHIIWTGGEPAQQLTYNIVQFFKDQGFRQSIETSGLLPVPNNLDYVCVSPKVAEHILAKNFPNGVDELRYIRHSGQKIPEPSVEAKHYMISPHSDGDRINTDNLNHCINLAKANPKWRLSVQNHKIWRVL